MRIVFTAHAKTVMVERGIDPEWVSDTLRAPEWIEPDPYRPDVERRFRRIPAFDGRVLRVAGWPADGDSAATVED